MDPQDSSNQQQGGQNTGGAPVPPGGQTGGVPTPPPGQGAPVPQQAQPMQPAQPVPPAPMPPQPPMGGGVPVPPPVAPQQPMQPVPPAPMPPQPPMGMGAPMPPPAAPQQPMQPYPTGYQMPPGGMPPMPPQPPMGGGMMGDAGMMGGGMPMGGGGAPIPPPEPEDTTPANFQLGIKLPPQLKVKCPASEMKFDEDYFIRLLAGSISLSKDEKKKIVESIPKLKQAQIDELIRIFEEEKQKFAALSKKHVPQLEKLAEQHYQEWTDLEAETVNTQKTEQDQGKADEIRKQLGL